MKKMCEKYNEACIKIFKMLSLLSQGPTKYEDIINIFNSEDKNAKAAAPVILNKYLNTLKIFGINITKQKNIYYLQNSFFSLSLDSNEIKALQLLKGSREILTTKKQKEHFDKFINNIEMRLNSVSKDILSNTIQDNNEQINEYFSKYGDLISECEKYCYENQKLEVSCTQNQKEYKLICNPREISYINQKAYLSVFNHISRQVFNVPLDKIISIKQMPLISKGQEIAVTVVYKIRNNLAKAYRLKEWESSDGKFDEEGWLTIINNNEDFDRLTKRLMRYDYNCKVVSPKSFKERMKTTIDETLKNYE